MEKCECNLRAIQCYAKRFTFDAAQFFFVVEWKRKLLTPYRKPDRSTGLIVSHTFMLYGDVGCVVCCVVLANSLKETRKKRQRRVVESLKNGSSRHSRLHWIWKQERREEKSLLTWLLTSEEQPRRRAIVEHSRAVPTQGYPRTIEREPLRCYYCCCATIIISRLFFPSHHRRSSSWRWNMLKCFHDDFEDFFVFNFSSSSRVVRVFCLNNSLSNSLNSPSIGCQHHFGDHRPIIIVEREEKPKASNDIQARTR